MKRLSFTLLLAAFAILPSCSQSEAATMCGCGYEKGTEQCCDETAARCDSCDKIKGSPGCCVE